MSSTQAAIKRLAAEYHALCTGNRRVREIYVAPLDDNLFEWHFTMRGPARDGLPYDKGLYHGALHFPPSYPFAPPDVVFLTPNGRFMTHTKICTTISSFHKDEWRPSYDVVFVLTSLRLFMASDDDTGVGILPAKHVPDATRQRMAEESWNYYCAKCKCRAREVWEREMVMYPELSPTNTTTDTTTTTTTTTTTSSAAATTAADNDDDKAGQDVHDDKNAADAVVRAGDGNGDATTSASVAIGDGTSCRDDAASPPSPRDAHMATHDNNDNAAAVQAVTTSSATTPITTSTASARVVRQPVLRIHVGQHMLCVRLGSIDRTIVTCLVIVTAIVLRWTLAWLIVQ